MLSCSRRLKMMFFVGLILLSGLIVEQTKVIQSRTLYSTGSAFYRSMDQFCDLDIKNEILDSKLLVDRRGEISIEDKRYLRCLSVNANATGVYKFMEKINFEKVTCKKTDKRFMKTGEMPVTFLTSFPGSGNSWTRYLIEELTGFYTGAMHNDSRLRTVFKGEGQHEKVIVVKTHRDVNQSAALNVDKAILLIRDPFDSIRSFYNYKKTKSHTGIIDEQLLDKQDFATFAAQKVANYTAFNLQWLNQFRGRVLIIFYHDLINDLLNSVTRIASFLGTNVTLKKLWCMNRLNNGHFKRGLKPAWLSRSNLLNAELDKNFTLSRRLVLEESSRRISNSTSVV